MTNWSEAQRTVQLNKTPRIRVDGLIHVKVKISYKCILSNAVIRKKRAKLIEEITSSKFLSSWWRWAIHTNSSYCLLASCYTHLHAVKRVKRTMFAYCINTSRYCRKMRAKLSLAGTSTSIIFVATNTCLSRQNTSFVPTKVCLSRQNYVCRDKSFVAIKIFCRDKHVTKFCRDKNNTCGGCRQWYSRALLKTDLAFHTPTMTCVAFLAWAGCWAAERELCYLTPGTLQTLLMRSLSHYQTVACLEAHAAQNISLNFQMVAFDVVCFIMAT